MPSYPYTVVPLSGFTAEFNRLSESYPKLRPDTPPCTTPVRFPNASYPYNVVAPIFLFDGDAQTPNVILSSSGNSYLNGGNVGIGIGTNIPAHKLSVNGTIGATEIIVASSGADYVFQPDYRLAPLNEIAEYIKTHRHLPDVPSASEVERQGLGVGEMQTKLLAKIEELTLHMIDADSRNARLEQQNRELAGRLEKIETVQARSVAGR